MARLLKQGDTGRDVAEMQAKLALVGYDPGAADGVFGPKTAAALLAFQVDRPDLEDDKIFGPMSSSALDAAVGKNRQPVRPPAAEIVPAAAAIWDAFLQYFVNPIVATPSRYGPGRGLWDPVTGTFLITYAPGRRTRPDDLKLWPNVYRKFYCAFHCTSLTNVFLSWITKRNALFTHAGNIPSLEELCEADSSLHQIDGGGVYRGFRDETSPIVPDGSGAKRVGIANVIDARELLDRARAGTLPTFMVFMQSTETPSGIMWWHHTGLYLAWEGKLFRFAADGYKSASSGYSGQALLFTEVNDANVGTLSKAFYRLYGVDTVDGTYGHQSTPIARLSFERFA